MNKENPGNYRENIQIGLNVSINPKNDRTRELLVSGIIKEILTSANFHPHGIMVALEDGTIGRVKEIQDNDSHNTLGEADPEIHKPSDFDEINMKKILEDGENEFVEYKSSALWSLNFTDEKIKETNSFELNTFGKNASKVIVAKSIAAFLNSKGGIIIIGIKENKTGNNHEIIGIESEYTKLRNKDPCIDGYKRMIIDEIIKPSFPSYIFNHLTDYIKITFSEYEDKTICCIKVNKSDKKVFLKIANKGLFWVRIDSETRELTGEEVVDYCERRFK